MFTCYSMLRIREARALVAPCLVLFLLTLSAFGPATADEPSSKQRSANRTERFIQRFEQRRAALKKPSDAPASPWGGVIERVPDVEPKPAEIEPIDSEPVKTIESLPEETPAIGFPVESAVQQPSTQIAPAVRPRETAKKPAAPKVTPMPKSKQQSIVPVPSNQTPIQPLPQYPSIDGSQAGPPMPRATTPLEVKEPKVDPLPESTSSSASQPMPLPSAEPRRSEKPEPTPSVENVPDVSAEPQVAPNQPKPSHQMQLTKPIHNLVVETSGPQEISLGEVVSYVITVHNRGQRTEEDAYLELTLPPSTTVIESMPMLAEGKSRWKVGTLETNEMRSFQVKFVCQTAGSFTMKSWLTMPKEFKQPFRVLSPALEIITAEESQLHSEQVSQFTFLVRNVGEGVARNVRAQIEFPETIKVDGQSIITRELGDLAPNEQRTATVSAFVEGRGRVNAHFTARAAGGVFAEATRSINVLAPQLRILAQGESHSKLGEIETYSVQIANEGSLMLEHLTIIVALDEKLSLVDAESGAHLDANGRLLGWELPKLKPNEVKTFRWWAVGEESGAAEQRLFVEADKNLSREAKLTTHLSQAPRLELQFASANRSAQAGEEVIYQLRLTNTGSVPAENLVISGELADLFKPIPVLGGKQSWNGNRVALDTVLKLEPGEFRLYQVRARALQAGTGGLKVRVTEGPTGAKLLSESSETLIR